MMGIDVRRMPLSVIDDLDLWSGIVPLQGRRIVIIEQLIEKTEAELAEIGVARFIPAIKKFLEEHGLALRQEVQHQEATQ